MMILDKNKLNNKDFLQKIAIVGIVVILLTIVAWRFVIGPLRAEKAKIGSAINEMKAKLEINQNWVAQATDTALEYEKLGNEIMTIIRHYMPPPVNAMAWAGDVLRQEAAKQSSRAKPRSIAETGISATPITGPTETGPSLFEEYNVRSEMICSYHDLGQFLAALEKANAFLRVAGLEIKPSPEEKEHLAITLKTSFLRFNNEAFLAGERPDAETPRILPKEPIKAANQKTGTSSGE